MHEKSREYPEISRNMREMVKNQRIIMHYRKNVTLSCYSTVMDIIISRKQAFKEVRLDTLREKANDREYCQNGKDYVCSILIWESSESSRVKPDQANQSANQVESSRINQRIKLT